jgi:peptidoglycan LD-endopeptidase LytH
MDRCRHSAGSLSTGDVVNRAQVECLGIHTICAVWIILVELRAGVIVSVGFRAPSATSAGWRPADSPAAWFARRGRNVTCLRMTPELKVAAATALFLMSLTTCSFLLQDRSEVSEVHESSQVIRLGSWPRQDQANQRDIIVPVSGVSLKGFSDTWGAPRDGGRTHKGLDIMAPKGTAVIAATNGRIMRLHQSDRGGISLYQSDEEGRHIFYYAHLDRYAKGVRAGMRVKQGQVIAYVGETGNAPVPHLHFEIQRQNSSRQWWRGEAFNPYPVLLTGNLPGKPANSPVLAHMK